MRLLFDAQLSPTLVTQLADVFPDSRHVHDLDLVTKDADFTDLAIALGAPRG